MNNKIHKQMHYINDDTNGTFISHTKTPKSSNSSLNIKIILAPIL